VKSIIKQLRHAAPGTVTARPTATHVVRDGAALALKPNDSHVLLSSVLALQLVMVVDRGTAVSAGMSIVSQGLKSGKRRAASTAAAGPTSKTSMASGSTPLSSERAKGSFFLLLLLKADGTCIHGEQGIMLILHRFTWSGWLNPTSVQGFQFCLLGEVAGGSCKLSTPWVERDSKDNTGLCLGAKQIYHPKGSTACSYIQGFQGFCLPFRKFAKLPAALKHLRGGDATRKLGPSS